VLVRKLKGVHGIVIVSAFVTISTPITAVLGLVVHAVSPAGPGNPGLLEHPGTAGSDATMLLCAVVVGIVGWGGQVCKTRGLQLEGAGAAAMMRNLDLPFSFLWQVLFLSDSEPINALTVFGAIVILSSSVAMGVRKYLTAEKTVDMAAAEDPAGGASGEDSDEDSAELLQVSAVQV
jgi:drug/metabolite transporter (DMT)-like permease